MKVRPRIYCIFSLFVLLSLFLYSPPTRAEDAALPQELLIGLIPEINVFDQMERFEPLAEYISEHTGTRVRLTILSRYGNIIEKFMSMKMDGAFFGSFTGSMAIQKLGVQPIARPVNLDGESTYHGLIFTRKDSGISSVGMMKGKKLAFVEKATTAGYIFPLAYFHEKGVKDINAYFSEVYFTGSHDAAVNDVYNGLADVGSAKNTVFDRVVEKSPEILDALYILARSDKVPSNGLCLRKDIDPSLKERLKTLLVGLDKSEEGRQILKKFRALRFVETTEKDYDSVSRIAEKAGISIRNYEYENR